MPPGTSLCHHHRGQPQEIAIDTVTRHPSSSQTGLFVRPVEGRIVAGVARGLGDRLGVDAVFIRAAFVTLTAAGGVGLAAYLLAWLVSESAGSQDLAARPAHPQRTAAVGLMCLGVLVLCAQVGLWFGDTLVWSTGLASVGTAVLWSTTDEAERARWTGVAARIPGDPFEAVFTGRISPLRILGGGVLVLGGMGAFLAGSARLSELGSVILAMLVTAAGASLILGPWMWRLARQLADERRERIRSEERAEVAAHLHDSVLQTLALIQRTDNPREMTSLARGQERELRAWLYGRGSGQADSLEAALIAAAARVEQHHQVPVEVVCVGDLPLDERVRALVQACGEAMTNAAVHSGAERVSVYAEVEDDVLTAYVTDEGRGFDVDHLPEGRHGITESIRGRMARGGGSARIRSEPGQGTEVRLELPRERS